jgi:hypothetical protein
MDRLDQSGKPEEEQVEDRYDIETRRIHGIVYGDSKYHSHISRTAY